MKENNNTPIINKDKSIKTNYNINRKQRIRRANSKPNISKRQNLINHEFNVNEKEQSFNAINKGNQEQKYNKNNLYKEYSTYNPFEDTHPSLFREGEYSINSKINKYLNTKRVIDCNYQEPPTYKKQLSNYNTPKDDWAEMLYHPTKNQNLANNVKNSKTFQSNIFPNKEIPFFKLRHIKESKYSDQLHKTQITTLPGCVKRGKNDIKDDNYFGMKNTESYLYKVEHDFNSNVYFGPNTKEEEKVSMNYPVEQRYHGSYKRGVKDNDIFNLNKEGKPENIIPGKKMFKNKNAFRSQIIFI